MDGTIGYVLSTELKGEIPKTPQEALGQQRSRAGKVSPIPLYDVDGKTVIGIFHIDERIWY